ncbi:efflux transporter outer membrane subunit [Magnetospirillum sulfuroxidans]|uniref:Efflux transporter outer membrane subunit n=1 Tax=Magnetospirillum sulfuroxidans TaxID=611300 RepID=A0ABS5IB17_9PROT|nr:efflux transporter outer membrane subunit [Magnetospirillum sulfuroxidans]MBR9971461.1 efflux transporter outer membrane subunit [Magnetospirillum sulfuroxidans]
MKRNLALILTLAIGGCTMGPDYQPPAAPVPAHWSLTAAAQPQGREWWQAFDDPQIAALVVRALAANPDLAAAEAAVRAARALAAKTTGGTWPELDLSTAASRSRDPASQGSTTAAAKPRIANSMTSGFDASWEVDLWGKLERGVQAATATAQASQAEADGVRLTLIGDVLRAYVEVRGMQLRLGVAEQATAAYADTVTLTEAKFRAGTGSGLDLVRAQAQLDASRAELPPLRATLRARLHALSILTGQMPEALAVVLETPAPVPRMTARPGLGVPADLVRKRPDLRQMERNLAAASAAIGVAEADLYPSLSLSGSIGLSSATAGSLLELASRTWSFGPSLVLPLLDGGSRRAEIAYRRAKAEQAEQLWRSAVLGALAEVEDALSAWDQQVLRQQALVAAVATSRSALDLASELNAKGMSSYLDVLDAQRELHDLEAQVAEAQVAVITDLISLYKALGGGAPLS